MTEINDKPTVRRTRRKYSVLYPGRDRHIVAAFVPGDVIEFHELRGRARWQLPIDAAFRYAIRCQANAERRQLPHYLADP